FRDESVRERPAADFLEARIHLDDGAALANNLSAHRLGDPVVPGLAHVEARLDGDRLDPRSAKALSRNAGVWPDPLGDDVGGEIPSLELVDRPAVRLLDLQAEATGDIGAFVAGRRFGAGHPGPKDGRAGQGVQSADGEPGLVEKLLARRAGIPDRRRIGARAGHVSPLLSLCACEGWGT